jgi:hypothetical protein
VVKQLGMQPTMEMGIDSGLVALTTVAAVRVTVVVVAKNHWPFLARLCRFGKNCSSGDLIEAVTTAAPGRLLGGGNRLDSVGISVCKNLQQFQRFACDYSVF